MTISSKHVVLQRITPELARRIVARDEQADDLWHPEYPFADELDPLRSLAGSASPDPIFALYQIRRTSDGLAIGGLGFFGPPDESGCVELGFGLVPSARGGGLATEAVRAALGFAKAHGANSAKADTDASNIASRRVLEKCGLVHTHTAERSAYYSGLTIR